jgi:RNA polymerase sigma factor (sigma-70 family)
MRDEEIIKGLKDGSGRSRAIFENEFYGKYKYFINNGRSKYKLSYDDSFSAYSDALLSAIHNIINGRFNHQFTLKTYLYRIFLNKCVDLLRKKANNKERPNQSTGEPEPDLPGSEKSAEDSLVDEEKFLWMKQCLDQIGEKCKEILLLHEDEYSDKEIAEILPYSNAAVVKTTRLRCREKLKSLFYKP